MIAGLGFRVAWAVANEAYRLILCAKAGHPEKDWVAGVYKCRCGQRFT